MKSTVCAPIKSNIFTLKEKNNKQLTIYQYVAKSLPPKVMHRPHEYCLLDYLPAIEQLLGKCLISKLNIYSTVHLHGSFDVHAPGKDKIKLVNH